MQVKAALAQMTGHGSNCWSKLTQIFQQILPEFVEEKNPDILLNIFCEQSNVIH